METIRLKCPVYTLDRNVFLPAGTELSQGKLDELIAESKGRAYPRVPILEYGTVHEDLLRALKNKSYQIIFQDPRTVTGVMKTLEKVQLLVPVLESLEYFRKYEPYTYFHILKVFALSTLLSQALVDDFQSQSLETLAGAMHDFGKICVPISILRKSTPLTRVERKLLEHHTLAGYVLVSYYLRDSESYFAKVAREHHERKDGSGYPFGLAQEDPMVEIIAVSDIYDALISVRPYRRSPYDNRAALEVISEMAVQGQVSWDVVRTLIAYNRKNRPHFTECHVGSEKRGTPPEGNLYGVFSEEGVAREV